MYWINGVWAKVDFNFMVIAMIFTLAQWLQRLGSVSATLKKMCVSFMRQNDCVDLIKVILHPSSK